MYIILKIDIGYHKNKEILKLVLLMQIPSYFTTLRFCFFNCVYKISNWF